MRTHTRDGNALCSGCHNQPAEHTRRDQNQNCTAGAALRGERRSGTSAWRRGARCRVFGRTAGVRRVLRWPLRSKSAHSCCRWASLAGGLDGAVLRPSVSESRDSRSTAGDTCAGRGSRRLADATLLADRHGVSACTARAALASRGRSGARALRRRAALARAFH